jgi:prophage antirepressor-like protein
MDILKAFKLLDKTIEINIQGTPENPLFHAKQIGNLLEISNIKDNIRDFTNEEKVEDIILSKGGPQKTTFLTEIGLYRLLGRSRKPVAHTFQKWMINTIKEIRINGFYKLKEENEVDKQLIIQNCDLITHKKLIKAYDQKNVIYLCRLKYLDGKSIVKIGSTQNIKERMSHMNGQFDNVEIIIIDIIEINNYRKFEKYLHNDVYIKNYYYPLVKKDGSESKETYLVSEDEIKEFIKIINENKKMYQDINQKDIEEIKLKQFEKECEIAEKEYEKIKLKHDCEIEKIKLKFELELKQKEMELQLLKYKVENNILNSNIIEISKNDTNNQDDNILDDMYEDPDDDEQSDEELDLTKTNFKLKPRTNGIRTPKVYQYTPENLSEPIQIFDSPVDVERCKELSHLEISPAPLRNASKNNTIYKGYRWLFLNRTEEPPSSIPETVHVKHKSPDIKHIAMIDIKRTRILEVYATQKDAIEARNMKCNSFTRAIQQQSVSSGHYWNFFEDCPEEWKNEYLKNHKLPERFVNAVGKKVEQIDPKTMKVLKVYNSNRDVIKLYQMSANKLRECFETGEIHNGYIWQRA